MAYLLRTFTQDTPSVGSVIDIAQEGTDQNTYGDMFDNDTGIVFPQKGNPVINTGPYVANAAVGYADPLFSLFPISSDFINGGNGEQPDTAAKKVIEQFGDYYEGLPELLRQGNLKDSIRYADSVLKNVADYYRLGPGDDNWGNFAMAELPANFPLKERNKYARLLRNLRGYGTSNVEDTAEYDRPQHAIIEAKIDDIQKARDKVARYSAENDGPNEFRVSKYTTKGLWTPRHVDTIIKKYFPDYIPGEIQGIKDNDRAKDAIQDIIQQDADSIISDEKCKNIIRRMNSQLNSFSVSNIAKAIKELGQ